MDDITSISHLKYRYLRSLDTKQWDDFRDCFVPDATGDYNGLEFTDREALVSYMRENLGEGFLTMHQVHHPEIEVDGDTATGRWYLQDKVIVPAFQFMLEGAAFYTDRYVRTPRAGGSPTPATAVPSRSPTTSPISPAPRSTGRASTRTSEKCR